MTVTQRVVAGMLALEEFTVADLVTLCQVKEPTVRTVVNRRRQYLDVVERTRADRRGGKTLTYRLKPDMREDFAGQLPQLTFESVRDQKSRSPHLQGLTMALDVLCRRVPLEADSVEAYDELLESARLALPEITADASASDKALHRVVVCLINLVELERAVEAGHEVNPDDLRQLGSAVIEIGGGTLERSIPPAVLCDFYRRLITGPAATIVVKAMQTDTFLGPDRPEEDRSGSHTRPEAAPTTDETWLTGFPAASRRYGVETLADEALRVRRQQSTFQMAP